MTERLLPSHSSLVCTDPLYITDEAFPTDWRVLQSYIAAFQANNLSLGHLPSLIQDLAYSLHAAKTDTRYLNRYIRKHYNSTNAHISKALLDQILLSALALPDHFPEHVVPQLREKMTMFQLTRAQLRSLVSHQLLGTIRDSVLFDSDSSLSCWYSEHPSQPRTTHGYLASLFHYFLQPLRPDLPEVTYELVSVAPPSSEGYYWLFSRARIFDTPAVIFEAAHHSIRPFPHSTITCTVLTCAETPTLGPDGSDEEIAHGTWPELIPFGCLFVSKPLSMHSAMLVRGLVSTCAWQGFGPKAKPFGLVEDEQVTHSCLFIDQPEHTDTPISGLVDLAGDNFYRTICKAYAGFLSLRDRDIREAYVPISGPIHAGQDPLVKILAWCIAAALTGIRLRFDVDEYLSYAAEEGMNTPDSQSLNLLHNINTLVSVFPDMSVAFVWQTLSSDIARECPTGWHVSQLLIFEASQERDRRTSAISNPYSQTTLTPA